MPRLSIITVNLNNVSGLRETIESIINQTFEDYEYIIIDGGSKDGSTEVIKEYADKITFWVSEPDKGIYNAMNKGILQSKGEYLQFLNSGDCLVDETILSRIFEIPRTADIVYGHLNMIYGRINKLLTAINEKQISLAYFYNNTISHPSAFISRRLFIDEMYDEGFKIAADKLFFMKNIIIKNCSLQQIDEIIVDFNTYGISCNPESKNILKEENNRIIEQIIPSRIIRDYQRILPVWNSPLLVYIAYLNRLGGLFSFSKLIYGFKKRVKQFLKMM